MTIQKILNAGVSRRWLTKEMYRRAAFHFEKCGEKEEAAECWAESGEKGKAAEIYLEMENHSRAAPLLLEEGRYADALECYGKWLADLADEKNVREENRVSALLGVSASLRLLNRERRTDKDMYQKARKIIQNGSGRTPASSGRCWEALGWYGKMVGRNDLMYVGYGNAMDCFGEKHPKDRLKTAGKYLDSVRENRLMAQDLELKTAEWKAELENAPLPPPVVLRSEPMEVSRDDFKEVFKLDGNGRPLEYVDNDFEEMGEVIFDRATGIMWQRAGSDTNMGYEEAEKYVKKLNRDRFAGFDDWRLPTVDELASLLEPEKQSQGLYIDPIFDEEQWWCLTSDKRAGGGAWVVSFDDGLVSWNDVYNYVRVCRV